MGENASPPITAADRDAEVRAMAEEVGRLLSRRQKELASKWFYDARGAELFDRITRLPEYYLTRVERSLLEHQGAAWLAATGARTLVELGPGSGEKAAILLRALPDGTIAVPVDISAAYLDSFAAELREQVPAASIRPVQSDLRELRLPPDLPRPLVVAFLGSTIGNFDATAATELLERIRDVLEPDDRLLLGADLRKDTATLEVAYNDAQGVTAEFNKNILHVLNRRLGADFDPAQFDHVAVYREERGVMEMHLRARAPMHVQIPGAGTFMIAEGETIRTEISTKYDRAGLERLLSVAGLVLEHWFTDDDALFALLVARRQA